MTAQHGRPNAAPRPKPSGLAERKRQPKLAVPQKGISPQIGFYRSALADEAAAAAFGQLKSKRSSRSRQHRFRLRTYGANCRKFENGCRGLASADRLPSQGIPSAPRAAPQTFLES